MCSQHPTCPKCGARMGETTMRVPGSRTPCRVFQKCGNCGYRMTGTPDMSEEQPALTERWRQATW